MIKPFGSFPVFTVNSLDAAKAFYSQNLGFAVAFENEWYLHLIAESGIQIGFLLPDQPTQPDIFQRRYDGNGVIFSLEVEDVDAAYAEARDKALDIVLELRAEGWGQRHFCLQDPNGLKLDIVQAIEPTDEYAQAYA